MPFPTRNTQLRSLAAASLLLVTTTLPSQAAGQDASIRYTTMSRVEIGGVLGRMVSALGPRPEDSAETVWASGGRMRTDQGQSSTIWDLPARRLFVIDHGGKEFMAVSLDDTGAMMSALTGITDAEKEEMRASMAEARAEYEAAREEMAADGVEFTVKVSSERTGERQRMAGVMAERVFVTVEVEGTPPPVDGEPQGVPGVMVMLTELWIAGDAPEFAALRAVEQEMAALAMAAVDDLDMESLTSVFLVDPRIAPALEQNQEALEALDGIVVRSTSHLVTVPPGVDFDRAAVLAAADRRLGDDLNSALSGVAQGAAQAARSAIGNIGGRFGRGNAQPEPEPAGPAFSQTTIMRMITEFTEIDTSPLTPDVFIVPEGYRERPIPPGHR